MKWILFVCDFILGLHIVLSITCGPEPLRYTTDTGAPYAFISDKPVDEIAAVPDTGIFRVLDTVHTGDSVTFFGLVIPPDSRITGVRWDFGDDTYDTLLHVKHAYKRSGYYNAKFSIFDAVGNFLSDSVLVCVNTPPDSVILISPQNSSTISAASPIVLSWMGYDPDLFDSALSYLVIVNHDSRSDTIVRWDDTTFAALDPAFFQGKSVEWVVVAKDRFGDTCLSSNGFFSVMSNTSVDTPLLSRLKVSVGTLIPAFSDSEFSYSDTIPEGTSSITITAVPKDTSSIISINNVDLGRRDSIRSVSIQPDLPNQITIKVTSGNRLTEKLYTLTVIRKFVPDTLLSSIELSAGTLRLSNSPVPDTLRDTVSFIDSIVTITPVAMDAKSVLSIDTVMLESPVKALPVKLDVGTRVVKIKVTSSVSQKSKVYCIFFVRKKDSAVPLTAPPSGVTAAGSSVSEITVTWVDNTDATYYTIQKSMHGDSGFIVCGTTSSNSYSDTALDSGSTWYYRVSASNSNGTTGYSTVVSATSFLNPDFVKQPQSVKVFEGTRALLSVDVKGVPVPSCLWQKNGKSINVTSFTCTTSVLTLNDNNAAYRCIISNAVGEKMSSDAIVGVDSLFTKPSILHQPSDTDVYAGDTVTFLIVDSGSYLKRQWRLDGVAVPGAVTCTLSIRGAKSTDAGVYTLKTWNRDDSAVCAPIRLRVLPRGSSGVKAEPLSASSIEVSWTPIEGALWYRVMRASESTSFASICSTSQTSIIDSSLIEGGLYSYKLSAGNSSGESMVKDSVTASTWYGPRITVHPQSLRILVGQSITLSVAASGFPACSYQWKKDGTLLSGATSAGFNLANAAVGDTGNYSVQITNAVRSVNSNAAHVQVVPTYTLSTTSVPSTGGTIVRSKVASIYEAGDTVRLIARAASGYRFTRWNDDSTLIDTSLIVIMKKNTVVSAGFVRQFKVNISIGKGTGTITPQKDTLCDSAVTLLIRATPAANYRFNSWAGDTSAVNSTISLKVTKERSINAQFTRQYKLGVSVGSGSGTISPSKDTLCDSGATIAVSAVTVADYRFTGWTGDTAVTSNSFSVKLLKNVSVAAHFRRRYTLTVTSTDNGTVSPSGTITVDSAASTAITATANQGCEFLGWRNSAGTAIITDTALQSTTVRLYSGNASVEARFIEIDTATCVASISADRNVSGTGPHRVVVETNPDSGIREGTIYRPEDLGPGKNYPIFVWGNGGCSLDGYSTEDALVEIASHGYFVIADGTPGGSGNRLMDPAQITTPARAYVTWAIAENRKRCSVYYRSLDTTKIAGNGFSCGGYFGQALAGDQRTATWGVTSSGSMTENPDLWSSVHTPVIIVVGSQSVDMAYQNGLRDYNGISALGHPCIFISNKNFGHGGDLYTTNGGHFTKINLAWLNWWLKGDTGATGKGALVGPTCNYCTDINWDVKSANIP